MGDGFAAFVVEASARGNRCAFLLETFAEGAQLCEVRGGGHRQPAFEYTPAERGAFQFHMDGKGVHKFASQHFPPLLARVQPSDKSGSTKVSWQTQGESPEKLVDESRCAGDS